MYFCFTKIWRPNLIDLINLVFYLAIKPWMNAWAYLRGGTLVNFVKYFYYFNLNNITIKSLNITPKHSSTTYLNYLKYRVFPWGQSIYINIPLRTRTLIGFKLIQFTGVVRSPISNAAWLVVKCLGSGLLRASLSCGTTRTCLIIMRSYSIGWIWRDWI